MRRAEGVGFEPTEPSLGAFQERCNKPLCHPSRRMVQDSNLRLDKPVTLFESAALSHSANHPGALVHSTRNQGLDLLRGSVP